MQIEINRNLEFAKKMLGGTNIKLRSHVRAMPSARDTELIEKYGDEDLSAWVSLELESPDLGEESQKKLRSFWYQAKGGSRLSNFDTQLEVDEGRLGFITRIESAIVSTLRKEMQYRYDLDDFSGGLSFDVAEEGVQVLEEPEREAVTQ